MGWLWNKHMINLTIRNQCSDDDGPRNERTLTLSHAEFNQVVRFLWFLADHPPRLVDETTIVIKNNVMPISASFSRIDENHFDSQDIDWS